VPVLLREDETYLSCEEVHTAGSVPLAPAGGVGQVREQL